jgi:tetratricopeptide (TPR) repeat protein
VKKLHLLALTTIGLSFTSDCIAQVEGINKVVRETYSALYPPYKLFSMERDLVISDLKTAEQMPDDNKDKANALWRIVEGYRTQLDRTTLERICKQVVKIREQISGPESSDLIEPLLELAKTKDLPNSEESRQFYERALKIERESGTSPDKTMIATMENLAEAYRYNNQTKEAIALRKELLTISVKAQAQAAEIAKRQAELAELYSQNSQTWSIAAGLYRQALSIDVDNSALARCEDANTLLKYGQLLIMQKKYKEADPVLRQSLKQFKKDTESKSTQLTDQSRMNLTSTLRALAETCDESGNKQEAEDLLKQALNLEKGSYPSFGRSFIYSQLGDLYYKTARYQESETAYKAALDAADNNRFRSEFEMTDALYHLAGVYRVQGKFEDAISLYKRELCLCEKQDSSPQAKFFNSTKIQSRTEALNALALCYQSMGKTTEQKVTEQQLWRVLEGEFGKSPCRIFEGSQMRASIYKETKRTMHAEDWYERAIAIGQSKCPKDNLLAKAKTEYASLLKSIQKSPNYKPKHSISARPH